MADIWSLGEPVGAGATGDVWSLGERPGGTVPVGRKAQDFGDSVIAGLQASSGGLAARGKMPDVTLPEDAPWHHRLASGVGGLAGDALPMAAGAIGAQLVTGGKAGPIGMGVATFAAPMALREALVEAYTHNYATTWEGVQQVGFAAIKGATKGALIGAATMGAGQLVKPLLGTAGATVAEIGTLTTTASALEGHLPTWQDFMDNALLLVGAKGAMSVARSMFHNYAETGKTPAEQVGDARADPALGKQLLTESGGVNYDAIGEQVGGVSHLRGIISNVAETYDRHGAEAARVKLEEFANAAPEHSNFSKELREIPGFVDSLFKETEKAVLAARTGIPSQYIPLALEERIKAAVDADPRPEIIRQVISDTEKPLVLGQDPIKNPVRAEYATDNDTYKGILRVVAEQYNPEIEAQRRGVVPNTQTATEALELLSGGKLGSHLVGEAANAAEITARIVTLRSALQDAHASAADLAKMDPRDVTPLMKLKVQAGIERVAAITSEVHGVLAEWGRAGQMVRMLKRDPQMMKQAEEMARLYETKGPLQDIARAINEMNDPAMLSKFAREATKATTFQQVMKGWRAAIFSGFQTWEANILGNVSKWLVDVPEKAIGATLYAAERAAHGDPLTWAQYKARALAPLYGLQLATMDAMSLVAEGQKVINAHGLLEGGKKLLKQANESIRNQDDNKMDISTARPGENASFVARAIDFLADYSFGALKIQDRPFRTVGERYAGNILAVDRATKEGWHPSTKEWDNAVQKYNADPTYGLDPKAAAETIARIEKAGAEQVFGERLLPKHEQMSAAISGTAWELLFPARRTPANLLSWAVQHTPLLNLISARWRADYAAGGERQAAAVARVVVGTGIAATAYGLAQNGMLTGGGLVEKEMGGTKAGAGVQNYSLVVDGKHYSVQRIEPVAKLLMLTGDLVEITNSPKITPEDRSKAAAMLVLAFANSTISTTYMSGLANTFRAALDPERYGRQWLEGYATSLVPKVLSQPVVMADPNKRQVDGILDAIQSQLPFLREKLLPKRDVWGEFAKNERLFSVAPIATTERSQEKVRTEAVRLMIGIVDAPHDIKVPGPFKASESSVRLSQTQRDIYKELNGKKAMEILSPLVNSPDWDKLPDFVQAKIYQDVLRDAGKQASIRALSPEERLPKLQQNINRMIRETRDAEEGTKPADKSNKPPGTFEVSNTPRG